MRAKSAQPEHEVLLGQSRTVLDWLDRLPAAAYATPSVLPGWDLRELVGHLVFAHRTLLAALDRPSIDRPLPIQVYVSGYRPNADQIDEASRSAASGLSGPETAALLAEVVGQCAERFAAGPLPDVVLGPRGPITAQNLLHTRIVELIVHSDDLSRSRPDQPRLDLARAALARATRTLTAILAGRHPGRSVEVRVPPYAAVQCGVGGPGPAHTRGTPPNVVETDPVTFFRLATGRITWADGVRDGLVPRLRPPGGPVVGAPAALLSAAALSRSPRSFGRCVRSSRCTPILPACSAKIRRAVA